MYDRHIFKERSKTNEKINSEIKFHHVYVLSNVILPSRVNGRVYDSFVMH